MDPSSYGESAFQQSPLCEPQVDSIEFRRLSARVARNELADLAVGDQFGLTMQRRCSDGMHATISCVTRGLPLSK